MGDPGAVQRYTSASWIIDDSLIANASLNAGTPGSAKRSAKSSGSESDQLVVVDADEASGTALAPLFNVRIVARSHAGRVRPNNEDAIGFSAADGVACLADGMGGLNAGEVASRHAVDSVLRGLLEGLPMESVVRDANRGIWERSCADPELHNMGTTLVALRLVGDNLWLANVGDSRIYRFREGALSQLTRDHSVVQQYVDSGLMSEEEARIAPNRNIITRALGIEGDVEVDVLQEHPTGDDVYMLCSDGVTDMLAPDQLQTLFAAHPQPENLVDMLVESANEAGGLDNISVVLVQVLVQSQQAAK